MNKKQKAIIFMGGNILQNQIVKQAMQLNFKTILFDKNSNCYTKNNVNYFYNISGKDTEKVIVILDKLFISYKFKLIVCNVSFCKENLYLFNERYGIFGALDKLSNYTNDKRYIYKNLTIDLLNKYFPQCYDLKNIKFPVVIKPKFGSASKDIKFCMDNFSFRESMKYMRAKYYNKIIIQEYVEGIEFRGYFLVTFDKLYTLGIVKREFNIHHIFVSAKVINLTISEKEFYRVFDHMGVKNTIVKVDFILNKSNNIKILEFDFNFDDYIAPILFGLDSPYRKIFTYFNKNKVPLDIDNKDAVMYSIINEMKFNNCDNKFLEIYIKDKVNFREIKTNNDIYGYRYFI